MGPIFESRLCVRYYEVDFNGDVKPVTILNYLQDAAAGHAKQLGVAVSDLQSRNLTWVLSRLHLQVDRYARAGEELLIRTWPSSIDGIFSCREFEIYDGSHATIARATTSWAAVNLQTRRPVSLKDHLPPYSLVPVRALPDDFASLPQPEQIHVEKNFQVRRSDLDINRHVNNAIYAEWALETVPSEVVEHFHLTGLEIGFRGEALLGDVVMSRAEKVVSPEGIILRHKLIAGSGGKELTRLRSIWNKG